MAPNGQPGMAEAEKLARWCAALRLEDLPRSVVEDAKLRVLDIVGVTLAASAMKGGDVVRRAALRLGSGGESRILGFGDRTSAASAAVANGAMAHALDYDDTHNESVIHVSAPIVTAALTLGEAAGASGRDVLTACAAGSELTCRIGSVAPGAFHARGFHPTGVVGTLGAAFVAGKLLGLGAERIRQAVGIAGSQAAGILEFFTDGTWAKQLHPGWAAHGGIAAAYLADAGFTGPATVLEGRNGLFRTHLGDGEYDFSRLARGLGEQWVSACTSFKPYPCGHVVHPFLDALLALHREERLSAGDVRSITCPTAAWMLPIMCEPREVKLAPATEYHAKFSFFFALAAALKFGRLGVEAFSEANIRDPEILDLARRIVCVPDPDAPPTKQFKGWVIVETTDGRRLERVVSDNWGSEANPMRPDQVRRKFRENAELALPAAQVAEIEAAAGRLESLERIADLIGLCCPR